MGAVLTFARVDSPRPGFWPLWERYASSFVDSNGRVVDPEGGDRTTSEGQSYGLFFALVANDRERFDRLLNWTTNNLAGGDMGAQLPSWLWGRNPKADGAAEWKVLDQHSAADADLWLAYSLCEAGRLWHQPQYGVLGRRMMTLIAGQEVVQLPGFGTMMLPGPIGFHPTPDTWLLNPSYLPLPVLARLATIDPQGPWRAIVDRIPFLLEQSARRGFVMDWVSYSARDGFQPASLPGNSAPAGGSYDAIRVYLWAGLTNPQTAGRTETLNAVPGMADYLAKHAIPPERVDGTGVVVGGNGPVGFSAALLPYLQAMALKPSLATQTARARVQLDSVTRLHGRPETYYNANLTLFGLGSNDHLLAFGRDGELQLRW